MYRHTINETKIKCNQRFAWSDRSMFSLDNLPNMVYPYRQRINLNTNK